MKYSNHNLRNSRSLRKILFAFLVALIFNFILVNFKTHAWLTQEEIEDFHKNKGYVIVRKMYNLEEIQEISKCADRLEEEAEKLSKNLSEGMQHKIMHKGTQFVLENVKGETAIHRLVWVGAAESLLLQLGQKKELLESVGQLLTSPKYIEQIGEQLKAIHLINQLHFKRPGKDARVEFVPHQDIENRKTFDPNWTDVNGKGSFVQTLIAIDPMTETNGPIKVIDGIPSEGNFHLKNIKDKKALEEKVNTIVTKYGSWKTITLDPGDVLFMHPLSIHKSEVTSSEEPSDKRRLFINGFACVGANTKPYPGEGSCQIINLPSQLKE